MNSQELGWMEKKSYSEEALGAVTRARGGVRHRRFSVSPSIPSLEAPEATGAESCGFFCVRLLKQEAAACQDLLDPRAPVGVCRCSLPTPSELIPALLSEERREREGGAERERPRDFYTCLCSLAVIKKRRTNEKNVPSPSAATTLALCMDS